MTQPPDPSTLSPVKRALLALEEMQGRLQASERRLREPIAVIGMGCRFPGGVSDPESCWELLRSGRDAVVEVPRDRWDIDAYYDPNPDAPGKMSTRWGGFLEQVDRFDPELFGISPREAVTMDPQQRLLLEVTWEALERAGQSPERLMGTRTGVFVGIATSDYAQTLAQNVDPSRIDAYFASGVAHSIASGRLSYCLGLQGASVSIDTACSSSLVAIHQACTSLRTGESQMAIAAGVNVVLRPDHGITFSKARMMAADGRCKAFDARADGFVRAEGCGVVLLKRLADAQRDGDPILAVIRGTAVNQDGASSGLTAPNGASQEALIRAALADAELHPDAVGYVEAHGTGTSLGDPIEIRALGNVFKGRSASAPLRVGSAKTNFGHLESAAGITGFIKAVLCLMHRELPPSLHFQTPNPHIAWEEMPVEVVARLQPFQAHEGRRIAGVSSFGFSGTNAHVLVEAAPDAQAEARAVAPSPRPAQLLTLSAKSDVALNESARRLRAHLQGVGRDLALADVCHSMSAGRSHFAFRLALPVTTREDLIRALESIESGTPAGIRAQLSGPARPKIAFLFTGQGAQYPGMGRELYDSEPVFRDVLDRCASAVSSELDRPLLEVMWGGDSAQLDQTRYTQPALYALEVALASLWRSWGVEPAVVLGHSVGEYAAACIAGVFTVEEGARLVAARGRLMQALPAGGGMLAVQGEREKVQAEVERALAGVKQVNVAAYNAPGSVVLSGAQKALEGVGQKLQAAGLRVQPLQVSHAFHSELLEPMLAEFERLAGAVKHSPPQMRWISNLTGEVMDWDRWSGSMGAYWRTHAREAVKFESCARAAGRAGAQLFLEVGPHGVLAGLGQAALGGEPLSWVASLRRGRGAWDQLLESVAQVYARGVLLDWERFASPYRYRKVALPTYPFQRERYWVNIKPKAAGAVAADFTSNASLLGRRIDSPAFDGSIFASQIGADTVAAFALDHRVFGVPILPGTAYLALAVEAATQVFESPAVALRDVEFREALALPETGHRDLQLIARRESAGDLRLEIFSRSEASSPWTLHFVARAVREATAPPLPTKPEFGEGLAEVIDTDTFYKQLEGRGLEFGPLFRGAGALRRSSREAVGQATLPHALHSEAPLYRIHPVLLDACVQVLAAVARPTDPQGLFLPVQIAACRIEQPSVPLIDCRAHATLRAGSQADAQVMVADVRVSDASGNIVATLEGVQLQRAGREALDRLRSVDLADSLVELRWEAEEGTGTSGWASPTSLAAEVQPDIERLSAATGWEQWNELAAPLDSICRAYIGEALSKLGWQPGVRVDTGSLAVRLGVKPGFTRLLDRFLALLAREASVERTPTGINERLDALIRRYPAFGAELTFVKRCGPELAEVLAGRRDPLHLLFPDNDASTAESLYRDSPSARLFNGILRDAVKAAVAKLPAGRRLRVLEIGGGTASTTAHVIDVLPADRTSYLFTDMSPLFAARAAERFADRGFLRAQGLDIERNPRSQGIEGHFDLIIAANVLHATRDLGETMRHVRELLAPGGLLVGIEVTQPQDWIDITFGLTEGWWRFTDLALRPDYPLISADQWKQVLAGTGFDEVALLPEATSVQKATDLNTVLIARAGARAQETSGRWLVLADHGGVGKNVARLLRKQGASVCLAFAGAAYASRPDGEFDVDPLRSSDLERLVKDAAGTLHGPIDRVMHLWSLDDRASQPQSLQSLRERTAQITGSALHLAQAMLKAPQQKPPSLCMVTRGAVALGSQPVAPLAATLWGWARAVRLEHPELNCVSVDLDPANIAAQAESLLNNLTRGDEELQVALRDGISHVARIARSGRTAKSESKRLAAPEGAHKLATRSRGVLDALYLQPITRKAAGVGEVEIRVRATGLNFRDVLAALDMYSGDQEPLGSECAGVVTAIGVGVEGIKVGDEVVAISPGAFATHIIANAKLVVPKPAALTAAQAASIPNVYLTAHWALNHLGRMKAGERVLIHAGAGGVGLAAIQLAQRAGAEVFATAGSDEKRAYLRSLGVRHVFSSRTTDFAREVREQTGGRGVDLVLNSLAGEFIEQSLALVAPGGRFLEIGRTGIWNAEQVSAAYPGISYHAIDLSQDYAVRPDVVRGMLTELLNAITKGELRVLPIRTFEVDETDAAFRFMAQARHIGKLVVTQPWSAEAGAPLVRADRTYWITGGLSGLGLAVARWLVERGARNLLLMGRRAPDEATRTILEGFEAQGARVVVAQGDVSSESAVFAARDRARKAGVPPFAGVIHAAGALDNAGIQGQSIERYANVFASKIDGAWLLDCATADEPLDFFVLFSSAAALLGSAGQSNHSAANAYLDALASARRAEGKPAISIQWGAWSQIGAAAGDQVASVLREKGLERISPARGLQAFEHVLRNAPAVMGVIAADWTRFIQQVPQSARRYYSLLASHASAKAATREITRSSTAPAQQDLVARLAATPSSKRRALLQAEVRENAIKVLGLAPAHPIDLRAPLASLGLDSLMAVELRNLLGRAIAQQLPATLLFDYPSIAAITDHIAKLLAIDSESAATPPPAPAPVTEEGVLDRVENLSEDELDRLLAERMQAS